MDPLTLLAGASIVGYLYNQQKRELNFQRNNSTTADDVARHYQPFVNQNMSGNVSCPVVYPQYTRPSVDPTYVNYINGLYGPHGGPHNSGPQGPGNMLMTNRQNQNVREKFENLEGVYLDKEEIKDTKIPELNQGSKLLNNFEKFGPNIPSNDLTSQNILDLSKRSISDFEHNNMVPFFGSKVTQNMSGTGVIQGNYIDGVSVNSGFDQSTPWNIKLNDFTGLSENYLSKRENGPFYSPAEQQTNYVFGQPLIREDLEQYKQSLSTTRNDLVPVPSEHVGPGIGLDPSIPAAGGFHEFTRILPNNVSDYKANQLENRINAGRLQTAGLPESYPGVGGTLNKNATGVPKNRPPRDWSQTRRPTMTNKFADVQNLEMLRSDYDVDKRPKNSMRNQTTFGYGSLEQQQVENFQNTPTTCVKFDTPVGLAPAMTSGGLGPARSETFMSQDNNIRSVSDCNPQPLLGPSNTKVGSTLQNNWYVNETDRGSIGPTMILQTGLKVTPTYNNTSFTDNVRTTTRETTSVADIGSGPSQQKIGSKFYTFEDAPRTTNKETTSFANNGSGPANEKLGATSYTYDDPLKTTNKETTNYVYTAPLKDVRTQVETSRFQFTGPESAGVETFSNIDFNKFLTAPKQNGGARTGTIRGSTLVKNYVPTPGRQNILMNPNQALGTTKFNKMDMNPNGAGTLLQALPNVSHQQNSRIMATPTPNPNRLVAIDSRQLADFQVSQLKENPLSIYTINPTADIPKFEANNEPDDYSDLITAREGQDSDFKTIFSKEPQLNLRGVSVYPPNGNPELQGSAPDDSVMSIYDNLSENAENNPLLNQGSSRTINRNPTFSGKAYSGNFSNTGTNPNEKLLNSTIYGSLNNMKPLDPDDRFIQGGPVNGQICEPNRALPFAGGTLMITGDLK